MCKVMISEIGKDQDKFLSDIQKGSEIWLTEYNLYIFCKDVLFPQYNVIYNKNFTIDNFIFRPDIRIDELRTIIEFQGYRHYCECVSIYKDSIKKEKIQKYSNWKLIEIPYFVQLSTSVIKYLFSIDCNIQQKFPHGFIHPSAAYPGNFSVEGLKKYKDELKNFPDEVSQQCNESLYMRSKYLKIPVNILNPT